MSVCDASTARNDFAPNPLLPQRGLQRDVFLTFDFLNVCFLFCARERETDRRTSLTWDSCVPRLVFVRPYLGPVPWEYKCPRETASVLTLTTERLTFITQPSLTTFHPCPDVLTTVHSNSWDWNKWHLIALQFEHIWVSRCKISDRRMTWKFNKVEENYLFSHVLLKERDRQLVKTPIRFVFLAGLWQIVFLQL